MLMLACDARKEVDIYSIALRGSVVRRGTQPQEIAKTGADEQCKYSTECIETKFMPLRVNRIISFYSARETGRIHFDDNGRCLIDRVGQLRCVNFA